jgi:hypothetical protein
VATCTTSLFADWTSADEGRTSLLASGWQLASGVPCAVSQSTLDLGIETDAAGSARTDLPSAGAYEFDGQCVP